MDAMNASLVRATPQMNDSILDRLSIRQIKYSGSGMDAKQLVANYALASAKYFPFVYNQVAHQMNLDDFIDAILQNNGYIGRTAPLLKWMPLFMTKSSKRIEDIIQTIIHRERWGTEVLEGTWKGLAVFADRWVGRVSPQLSEQIFSQAMAYSFDHSVHHFVPQQMLPNDLTERALSRYSETTLDNLPVSKQVIPTHSQDQRVTACSETQSFQWEAIIHSKQGHYKNLAIINIDGRPAFIYKKHNQHNMVALRTMLTSDGRFAAIRGGVYAPPKELWDSVRVLRSPRHVVEVKGPIKVKPLGWIDAIESRWGKEKRDDFLQLLSKIELAYSSV
jgi:hypothetical protein